MFYGEQGIKDRIEYLRPTQVGTVIIPAPDYTNSKNWTDELREKNGYTKLEDGSWATVINVQDYLDKLEKDILELHQEYKNALIRGDVAIRQKREMEYGLRVAGKALEKSLAITKEMIDE